MKVARSETPFGVTRTVCKFNRNGERSKRRSGLRFLNRSCSQLGGKGNIWATVARCNRQCTSLPLAGKSSVVALKGNRPRTVSPTVMRQRPSMSALPSRKVTRNPSTPSFAARSAR